jgi:hypothetical protein
MADEETGGEGAEEKGTDKFDPKTLSPEAKEYQRREIQSESDRKAEAMTAVAVGKLRAEQARSARSAVESAEERELKQLADAGNLEGLGARVKARLDQRSVEERVIFDTSDVIERQMKEAFTETLGAEKVEAIHKEVVDKGGAHAEFALGLAKAADTKTRAEEIQAEVKAQLAEARGEKRDTEAGPDKGTGGGQGPPPEGFDKVEQDYIDGKTSRKAYEAAMEARDKGK